MNFRTAIFFICYLFSLPVLAQYADFSKASIVSFTKGNFYLQNAVTVFQEEIEKRSSIKIPVAGKFSSANKRLIVICTDQQLNILPENFRSAVSQLSSTGKDGYRIIMFNDQQVILVAGHEERGALYGVGYFLRKMEMRKGEVLVPAGIAVSSTPAYPIRGHQLGYRPKTNAYDAWTVNSLMNISGNWPYSERTASKFFHRLPMMILPIT